MKCNKIIVVRGGGDIASGTIQKLHRSGFSVLVLETEAPAAIRRKAAFSEAVYEGSWIVEDIKAVKVNNMDEIASCFNEGLVPVLVDPYCNIIPVIKPLAVVDAILAKKNLGTSKNMAPITIGLGPGFTAGKDVHIVIETKRGHNLGRLIFNGCAAENTGIPGNILGYTSERVVYSPSDGIIENMREIGNLVYRGELLAMVSSEQIVAPIDGILRGIIRSRCRVSKGIKLLDIDPRIDEPDNYRTISEKARNIAGGVLEAVLYMINKETQKEE